MRKISRHNKYFFVTDNSLSDYSIWSQVGGVLEMGMISFPILYFCSIIMMTLSCHIVNVKPKVKMKNEDVDVLWVCIDFLIFSYLQITPQYGSSMNSGSSSLDLVMVQYFKPSSSILVVVTSSAPPTLHSGEIWKLCLKLAEMKDTMPKCGMIKGNMSKGSIVKGKKQHNMR